MPSAPTPRWRSQSQAISSFESLIDRSRLSSMTKSLPAPFIFQNLSIVAMVKRVRSLGRLDCIDKGFHEAGHPVDELRSPPMLLDELHDRAAHDHAVRHAGDGAGLLRIGDAEADAYRSAGRGLDLAHHARDAV